MFFGPGARVRGRVYATEVRLAVRIASLALVVVTSVACSSTSNDACTCVVEQSGERRTLACGEAACVGGVVMTCAEQNKTAQRGACADTVETSEPAEPPSSDAESAVPPDPSCDNLRAYCMSSCSNPASVSADCQSTASSGDPRACVAWQLTNGLLCIP